MIFMLVMNEKKHPKDKIKQRSWHGKPINTLYKENDSEWIPDIISTCSLYWYIRHLFNCTVIRLNYTTESVHLLL